MPFNTALSGLKAASADLKVTGNNIANASTTGFKESRVEFSDVYAKNILGTGSTMTGSGVKLQRVRQQFEQGTVSFTSNSLDVAIDGEGFFIIENQGARSFTRAGVFGVDKDGIITTNSGARVQGFSANDAGTINSILGDIFIETGNLEPQATTLVDSEVNLDAEASVLATYGTRLSTQGLEIGEAQAGVAVGSSSVVETSAAPTAFDFSINTSSNISAPDPITPFDFSVNDPSVVTGTAPVTGFDFSLNSPSSLTASQAPIWNIDYAANPGSSFNVTVAGGTQDKTVTVNLTDDIQSFQQLLTNIRTELQAAAPPIGVSVRDDPANPGRLQFYSTDSGMASLITLDTFVAGAPAALLDITNMLRLTDGATSAVPGAGATGVTGSLTAATFDVTIAGGSGVGGDEIVTLTLNQNIANGDVASLVTSLNTQLAAVISPPGIDVRVREDPQNAGLIQFYATTLGEPSTVTVDNYQLSANVGGDVVTTVADVTAALGDIVAGSNDNTGRNTAVSFEVNLSGGANGLANTTATVVLNSNITTLQGLITDIRDDLSATSIGIDVREDPTNIGQLQFYAIVPGEASTITIDPNATLAASLEGQVTQSNVENALGGISMSATNVVPDPTGLTGATGVVGNITSASFDITLSGASQNNGGPITITLNSDIQTLQDLIDDIQDELRLTNVGVDVREDPDNAGRLQFFATSVGEASTITVNNLNTSNIGVSAADLANALNITTGITVLGIAAVGNGYGSQQVDFVDSGGVIPVTSTVTTLADESAQQIAARFNSVEGVTASASTVATVTAAGYSNVNGNLVTTINGVAMTSDSLSALMDEVNNTPSFAGISATLNSSGDLLITSTVGEDLTFSIASSDTTDSISVLGTQGNATTLDLIGGDVAASVGGTVDLILSEDIEISNAVPDRTGLFGELIASNFTDYVVDSFNPLDQETYNSATSVTVFDSLGNSHVLTQYFVKEPYRPDQAGSTQNTWTMYVQIDGRDVGDPDPSLTPPFNTAPTMAGFTLRFDETGRLDELVSDIVHITNWQPSDENNAPTGALGPLNIVQGAILPIADPPVSSNFVIDVGDSTQFGSVFSVTRVDQNGYTTGQLNGLGISANGIITARYTNGEDKILAQLALANFSNTQGLKPNGDTSWVQSFESGEPIVGAPRSASLGAINSGALEESNVELSEQLVRLIIAQRNFQASAKTIQTADAVTQTIINLR